MPASYPVRVYFYTGFNTGNVPAEASILEQAQYKDYDAVFRFQTRNLATVRLNAPWFEIKDADYLRLSVENDLPVYYVVGGVTMLSASTAELSVVMDPLLSCGGLSALTVVDGWLSRSHVGASEDTLFNNILPEPWAPQNHLRILAEPQEINPKPESDTAYLKLVGTTVNLPAMRNYAATLLAAAENPDANVVIPKLEPLAEDDYCKITFDGEEYTLPGIALYFMPLFTDEIALLRQIGVDSAITSTYVIPTNMIETPTGAGAITRITGKVIDYDIASKYQYGTVKNKKAVALYNTYTLMSAASGSVAEFEAHELFSGGTSPAFRVKIDPSPTGTAYCQPTYYEGRQVKRLEHSVAGMQWLSAGLIMAGASGGALTVANASRANKMVDYNANLAVQRNYLDAADLGTRAAALSFETGAAAAGGISDVITLDWGNPLKRAADVATERGYLETDIKRAILSGQDINVQTAYQMGENRFASQVSANVVAPEIRFPVTVNNAAYFGNSFLVYHVGLSDNDLARFDRFLTLFGYAVDQPLDKAHLSNRTHFNYVKTSEAHFKAPGVSATMLTALSDMLNRGVRIWHELPNNPATLDNPAKEGT